MPHVSRILVRCALLFGLGWSLSTGWAAQPARPEPKAPAADWKVGVATRKLTPAGPIWMAGYANRAKPSDGVDLDVFAKAVAIEDAQGGRVVIVTLDLVGVPDGLRAYVERHAAEKFGLKPHEILLNASHTHSAPQPYPDRMVLERLFSRMAKQEDVDAVNAFEIFLQKALVELIGESRAAQTPCRMEFSQARAGFAMNRRRPDGKGNYSNNPYPAGPVDQEVPVLKVTTADGKIKALLFGYACHNTTLGGTKISGDYAGYAQQFLETSYPGATALFVMGCGADQNPYPRRGMVPDQSVDELVKQHGRALSNAVSTALNSPLRPIKGPLRSAYDHAILEYEPLSKVQLNNFQGAAHTPAVIERARNLIQALDRGERPKPLPCPVQVVKFGNDLTLVAIGGEVTVDYSLRLKRELKGPAAVWVAGYSNSVFGYLGSRRVIEEGGYEGGGANIRILNHPGPFKPETEDVVIAKVHGLLRQVQR
ncbi:MAG: neutral/alkaline non-lysosomal ceramidase N-terminal domain-containing protein [Opitutaceae bacterium]|nr:neutral/alkaline non-lysosomal ceramidase N-terminal domain-containing protein [Opitutaceae bacterium]